MLKREITVQEFQNIVNAVDDILEPIILKRENKSDLIVINLEEYQKAVFLNELGKSKNQYKKGKIYSARGVFKGLREKYGY